MVLLHGALGGVHSWSAQVPTLAERYRVCVIEQRGRGHTPDVEGPITYEAMAEDTIAFLGRTVQDPAHVICASDGGIIGLLAAMQRPELLRKLVVIGSNFHRDGLLLDSQWADASPDDETWAMARQRYEAASPDGPDHWPVVFEKVMRNGWEGPNLKESDVASISIPVLVMAGDDDAVKPAHTIDLYEALPLGQLAVIPGTSHAAFMEKPDLVNRLILDFLAEEGRPQTLLPIRRASGEAS